MYTYTITLWTLLDGILPEFLELDVLETDPAILILQQQISVLEITETGEVPVFAVAHQGLPHRIVPFIIQDAPVVEPVLFNRYHVLDNVEETGKSEITSRNGLGLAICKSTAELMGGAISVRSQVGHFAEFTVTLPQGSFQEAVVEKTDTKVPRTTTATESLPSILVVDDNPSLGKMLQDSLTDFDVHFATNADEALAWVRHFPPNLILTDIMMSGMDGIMLTSVIKSDKHLMHIPVVILSAKDSTDDRIRGFRAGADAYLTKPFSINELRAIIHRILFSTETLHEYYNTSASAFRYNDGKLISARDDMFLSEVTDYLEKHLSDPDLSVENLAAALNLSTRNLYRKYKSLDLLPPAEFIREYRLRYGIRIADNCQSRWLFPKTISG